MTDTTNICEAIKGLPDNDRLRLHDRPVYKSDEWGMNRYLTTVCDAYITTNDLKALVAENEALRERVDALALADAADNYCDRCGDIVQVNAIERAIRAERERIAKQLEEFVWKHNNDERHIGVEPCQVCQICDELCAIYTTLLREEGK